MYARRRRRYFVLMGTCLVLFISAWAFVRLLSVPAAIGMCVVAMIIPPVAAIAGNRREPDDRWWDEPEDDRATQDGRAEGLPGDRNERRAGTDTHPPSGSSSGRDGRDGRRVRGRRRSR